MKFKIKFADQIVGLFIIIALVLFGTIIILLGINQRWFAKNYHFKTNFSSGSSLAPGTGIFMKGFQVGKIDKTELNDGNMVNVDFHIYDTYYPKVFDYSLLELSVSPIGLGSQLLFHPGLGKKLMEEGAFMYTADSAEGKAIIEKKLVFIPPKDDTITRLLSNVNPLLENLNQTLVEVNSALSGKSSGPAGAIVKDLSLAAAKLPGTMENVDAIVADVQSRVAALLDQVSAFLAETQGVVSSVGIISGNLESTSEALRDPTGLVPRLLDPKGSIKTFLDDDNVLYKRVISIVSELEKSIKSLQQIVTGLNGEVPKIAAVLNETKSAIQKAQDVLEGVKNNPLISGGVPERAEQDSLYQSMREGSFE